MKWMLCVCVAWCIMGGALAAASYDAMSECPSLTEEKLAQLKALVVSEDVHDQMAGDFTEVWGPKPAIEKDENTCIKNSRQKVDDKQYTVTSYLKGEWFGGEKTKNGTLVKVENGIYNLKKGGDEVKARVYVLYAKNHVFASYACKMDCKGHGHGSSDETKKPEEKKHDEEKKKNKLPFWSTISIRAEDLKTPYDEAVQTSIKEAVEVIQTHKELLGEIIEYPHPC